MGGFFSYFTDFALFVLPVEEEVLFQVIVLFGRSLEKVGFPFFFFARETFWSIRIGEREHFFPSLRTFLFSSPEVGVN